MKMKLITDSDIVEFQNKVNGFIKDKKTIFIKHTEVAIPEGEDNRLVGWMTAYIYYEENPHE